MYLLKKSHRILESWTGSVQPYKYNGKEFDRMYGLNYYDYGARMYSATEGIWKGPDPLAEKYYSISPYVYCLNNPVKFVDPDGRDPKNPAHWLQFAKDLYKASTAVISIGFQASANIDISVAKVGLDANAGSFDLIGVRDGTFTPGKNTPRTSKGVEIDAGVVSFSTGTTTTDTGKTTVTENNISIGVSVFEFYQTETIETNQSTSRSTTTTENGVKAADLKVKAALGLGVELGLDTEKTAKALYDLLTKE